MSMTTLEPSQIRENPKNPRRHFDDPKQKELEASIRQQGILQPLIVRPLVDGGYELVCGHRRLRAAMAVDLDLVPVDIREYNDREALEAAISENGQRSDISPLEEAYAFKALRDDFGASTAEIAARVSKSESHVHRRLKLAELPEAAKKALEEGTLALVVAEDLLRIPDAKQQAAAAAEVTKEVEGWVPGSNERIRTIPSPAEARAIIRSKYMLQLANAPFDTADAQLVPGAGACKGCPNNTASQVGLFGEFTKAALCTNAKCFDAKREADWKKKTATAAERGLKVLPASKTKEVFDDWGQNTVKPGVALVDLGANASWEYVGNKTRTWAQLLKKHAPAPSVIARDYTGAARELVTEAELKTALKKAGVSKTMNGNGLPKTPKKTPEDKAKEAKAKEEEKVDKLAVALALPKVVERAEERDFEGMFLWTLLARWALDGAPTWDEGFRKRRGTAESLEKKIDRAQQHWLVGFILECALLSFLDTAMHGEVPPELLRACEEYGIDFEACQADARAKLGLDAPAPAKSGSAAKKTSAKKAAPPASAELCACGRPLSADGKCPVGACREKPKDCDCLPTSKHKKAQANGHDVTEAAP